MRIGTLLILAGGLVVASQLFRDAPWQAGFVLGLALIVAGGLAVADGHQRRIRRRRRRPGYVDLTTNRKGWR